MEKSVRLFINGTPREVAVAGQRSLLSVLRDDLSLTGCKYGCGEGECGACTVLVDGKPTRSCITAVGECAEKKIRTIEGLAKGERLHPLQQAFIDCGAMQCGYCTTGMIMIGVALLEQHQKPTRQQIVEQMNGNVCRCGTYSRIIAALERAGAMGKGGGE